MILLQIQSEIFFLPTSKHRKAKFCLFLAFVAAAVHLPLKFHLSKLLNPVPKQRISKGIPSYGSQSERAKIAIHWFDEY